MFYSRDRRRNGGFTLIEVMLVMVILVVLASFAIFAVGPVQRNMKLRQAKIQVGALDGALGTYQIDIGMPPTTEQGLPALRNPPADLMNPMKWAGPYLKTDVPPDPWDQPYQYVSPGLHNPDSFDVWTVSPDGVEIGNWTEGSTP